MGRKKLTETEKLVNEAVRQAVTKTKEDITTMTIRDCHFESHINTGEALELIAEGLIENAKGLGVLAECIKSSNINTTALRVDQSDSCR